MSLDPLQLQRWIDGTCNDAERADIELLLATQPHLLNDLLNDSWENANAVMPAAASDRLQTALRARIKPRGRVHPLLRRAAVAAAVIAVVVALRWQRHTDTPVPVAEAPIHWNTFVNTHPNKVKITLPDGSRVWLHERSSLQYAGNFTSCRQVQLSGEAFFDVAANVHPFTLVSGHLQTTVLGTRFNVEAYPQEHMARVSLLSGKVVVRLDKQQVILQPGRALTADAQGIREEAVNLSFSDAWLGNDMVFDHLPLANVLHRTGDHYGLKIVLDAPLPAGRYFTSVLPGNNLKAALSNLSFVYKLHFHQQGDTLRVTP